VAVVRLGRHIDGLHMGRSAVVVLRLHAVVRARRSMVVAAGLREKLVGRDRRLVTFRRRDVACHMRVIGNTLVMAAAMGWLSGIAIMRLSQREIFARRRRRRIRTVMVPGKITMGEIVHMLKRRRVACDIVSVSAIMVIGGLGVRNQILIGLRRIGH
jgi:hypothetical protein